MSCSPTQPLWSFRSTRLPLHCGKPKQTGSCREQAITAVLRAEETAMHQLQNLKHQLETQRAKIQQIFGSIKMEAEREERAALAELDKSFRNMFKKLEAHREALKVLRYQIAAKACFEEDGTMTSLVCNGNLTPEVLPEVSCIVAGHKGLKAMLSECWAIVETAATDGFDTSSVVHDGAVKAALEAMDTQFRIFAADERRKTAEAQALAAISHIFIPTRRTFTCQPTFSKNIHVGRRKDPASFFKSAVSPNGGIAAFADKKAIFVVDVAKGEIIEVMRVEAYGLWFSHGGTTLFVSRGFNSNVSDRCEAFIEVTLTGKIVRSFSWPLSTQTATRNLFAVKSIVCNATSIVAIISRIWGNYAHPSVVVFDARTTETVKFINELEDVRDTNVIALPMLPSDDTVTLVEPERECFVVVALGSSKVIDRGRLPKGCYNHASRLRTGEIILSCTISDDLCVFPHNDVENVVSHEIKAYMPFSSTGAGGSDLLHSVSFAVLGNVVFLFCWQDSKVRFTMLI